MSRALRSITNSRHAHLTERLFAVLADIEVKFFLHLLAQEPEAEGVEGQG